MRLCSIKHAVVSGLLGLVTAWGLTPLAQAREGQSVTVGINAPVLMLPAPVAVSSRPVLVAVATVEMQPAVPGGERREARKPRGKGWHEKHKRDVQGRSEFWQYEAAPQSATVVVQAAPHVWLR